MEIELKLAVARDDVPRVQAALSAMARNPRASRSSLTSTYYDTPDHRLRRDEMILRIRKRGRHFIQTVKANDLGGSDILARSEWEDEIATETPDLEAPISSAPLRRALAPDGLHPVFTTIVRRTVLLLEPLAGTQIEAAIDEGEIRTAAGGGREAISEVELELKRGDPAVLYDIALRLVEVAPLRLEMRSKAERGYHLVEGSAVLPPVMAVRRPKIDAGMTAETVLQLIGRRCLTALLRNEPAALAAVPAGVHQMRVALRRLRAALAAFKPMLSGAQYRWADGELKWLADALGPARNWDVFATHLLAPVMRAIPDAAELLVLSAAAEGQRTAAYAAGREALLSPRYTIAVLKLARWFEGRGWRDQPVSKRSARLVARIDKVVPDLLQGRYRQARKRSKGFATATTRERHKLRIAIKKLRYTIDFLKPLTAKRHRAAFLERLKRLQDDLGQANDVRTAPELLRRLQAVHGPGLERAEGLLLGWHDRGLTEREATSRKHVAGFRAVPRFW